MTKIQIFQDFFDRIGKEIREAIITLLKENDISSVNIGAYTRENSVTGYTFYAVDKHGYAEALNADILTVNGDKITIDMTSNEDGYFGQCDLDEFQPQEQLYLLQMLSEIIHYSKENGQPILKEHQEFDNLKD